MEEVSEYSWEAVSCVSSIVESRKSEDTWDSDVCLVRFWIVDQGMNVLVPAALPFDIFIIIFREIHSSYRWEILRFAASTAEGSSMGVMSPIRNHPRCRVGLREMGCQGKRGNISASWVMVRCGGDR